MHQYYEGNEYICSICDGEFDVQLEGGITGFLGVLPVSLCPMCHSGLDMLYTELHGCHEEEEDDESE